MEESELQDQVSIEGRNMKFHTTYISTCMHSHPPDTLAASNHKRMGMALENCESAVKGIVRVFIRHRSHLLDGSKLEWWVVSHSTDLKDVALTI